MASFPSCASANITGEITVWHRSDSRRISARFVTAWSGGRVGSAKTVRSETAIPSFSNSPWIRGAPYRQFSAAMRRIRSRHDESIHGLPGRRERRRQHRHNPSRCQRSTVAGWTSTSASLRMDGFSAYATADRRGNDDWLGHSNSSFSPRGVADVICTAIGILAHHKGEPN